MNLDKKTSELIENFLIELEGGPVSEFYSSVNDADLFSIIMMAIAAYQGLIILKPAGLEKIKESYGAIKKVIVEFTEEFN